MYLGKTLLYNCKHIKSLWTEPPHCLQENKCPKITTGTKRFLHWKGHVDFLQSQSYNYHSTCATATCCSGYQHKRHISLIFADRDVCWPLERSALTFCTPPSVNHCPNTRHIKTPNSLETLHFQTRWLAFSSQ